MSTLVTMSSQLLDSHSIRRTDNVGAPAACREGAPKTQIAKLARSEYQFGEFREPESQCPVSDAFQTNARHRDRGRQGPGACGEAGSVLLRSTRSTRCEKGQGVTSPKVILTTNSLDTMCVGATAVKVVVRVQFTQVPALVGSLCVSIGSERRGGSVTTVGRR